MYTWRVCLLQLLFVTGVYYKSTRKQEITAVKMQLTRGYLTCVYQVAFERFTVGARNAHIQIMDFHLLRDLVHQHRVYSYPAVHSNTHACNQHTVLVMLYSCSVYWVYFIWVHLACKILFKAKFVQPQKFQPSTIWFKIIVCIAMYSLVMSSYSCDLIVILSD